MPPARPAVMPTFDQKSTKENIVEVEVSVGSQALTPTMGMGTRTLAAWFNMISVWMRQLIDIQKQVPSFNEMSSKIAFLGWWAARFFAVNNAAFGFLAFNVEILINGFYELVLVVGDEHRYRCGVGLGIMEFINVKLTDNEIVSECAITSILKIFRKSFLIYNDEKSFLARFGVALSIACQQVLILICDWLRVPVIKTFSVRVEYLQSCDLAVGTVDDLVVSLSQLAIVFARTITTTMSGLCAILLTCLCDTSQGHATSRESVDEHFIWVFLSSRRSKWRRCFPYKRERGNASAMIILRKPCKRSRTGNQFHVSKLSGWRQVKMSCEFQQYDLVALNSLNVAG